MLVESFEINDVGYPYNETYSGYYFSNSLSFVFVPLPIQYFLSMLVAGEFEARNIFLNTGGSLPAQKRSEAIISTRVFLGNLWSICGPRVISVRSRFEHDSSDGVRDIAADEFARGFLQMARNNEAQLRVTNKIIPRFPI